MALKIFAAVCGMRACECVCGVCVCMCLSVCLCGMPAECVRTCVWCVRMVCRLSKHVRVCVCWWNEYGQWPNLTKCMSGERGTTRDRQIGGNACSKVIIITPTYAAQDYETFLLCSTDGPHSGGFGEETKDPPDLLTGLKRVWIWSGVFRKRPNRISTQILFSAKFFFSINDEIQENFDSFFTFRGETKGNCLKKRENITRD